MSIKAEVELGELKAKVLKHQDAIVEIAFDVNGLKDRVEELNKLLREMTRASTPRGKAA